MFLFYFNIIAVNHRVATAYHNSVVASAIVAQRIAKCRACKSIHTHHKCAVAVDFNFAALPVAVERHA